MKRGPKKGAGTGISAASAAAAWGEAIPDWIVTLAQMCDRSSQAVAAKEIGYSGSVVNAVIRNSYKADIASVEKAVRGRFLREVVACPVLGEIGAHICLEHQKRAVNFSAGSSFRVAIARACRGGCPHSRLTRAALPPAEGL